MKRAVSISIGSSERDHKAEIELLGERVQIERIGTDGDMEKATRLYNQLDGQVDAFGVGGADLELCVADRKYPFPQIYRMIAGVKKTPVVDGGSLQNTLECEVLQFVEREIGECISPRTCLIPSAASRYRMAQSVVEAGYDIVFGGHDVQSGTADPASHFEGRQACCVGTYAHRHPRTPSAGFIPPEKSSPRLCQNGAGTIVGPP